MKKMHIFPLSAYKCLYSLLEGLVSILSDREPKRFIDGRGGAIISKSGELILCPTENVKDLLKAFL